MALTQSGTSTTLPDLPTELLVTRIFPNLGPCELARLLRVNIRLNSLVLSYLKDIRILRMGCAEKWGTCARNCFKFMTSQATKLVSITDEAGNVCITNKDLLRAIKRNPNLEKIDLPGFRMSQKVLKQILLCEKLTDVTLEQVGLWATTGDNVLEDIERMKKKGIRVNIAKGFGSGMVFVRSIK